MQSESVRRNNLDRNYRSHGRSTGFEQDRFVTIGPSPKELARPTRNALDQRHGDPIDLPLVALQGDFLLKFDQLIESSDLLFFGNVILVFRRRGPRTHGVSEHKSTVETILPYRRKSQFVLFERLRRESDNQVGGNRDVRQLVANIVDDLAVVSVRIDPSHLAQDPVGT